MAVPQPGSGGGGPGPYPPNVPPGAPPPPGYPAPPGYAPPVYGQPAFGGQPPYGAPPSYGGPPQPMPPSYPVGGYPPAGSPPPAMPLGPPGPMPPAPGSPSPWAGQYPGAAGPPTGPMPQPNRPGNVPGAPQPHPGGPLRPLPMPGAAGSPPGLPGGPTRPPGVPGGAPPLPGAPPAVSGYSGGVMFPNMAPPPPGTAAPGGLPSSAMPPAGMPPAVPGPRPLPAPMPPATPKPAGKAAPPAGPLPGGPPSGGSALGSASGPAGAAAAGGATNRLPATPPGGLRPLPLPPAPPAAAPPNPPATPRMKTPSPAAPTETPAAAAPAPRPRPIPAPPAPPPAPAAALAKSESPAGNADRSALRPKPMPPPVPRPLPVKQEAAAETADAAKANVVHSQTGDAEEDTTTQVVRTLKKQATPLGVSFFVHMVLIIALGLLTVAPKPDRRVTLQASLNNRPGERASVDVSAIAVADVQPVTISDERPLFTPSQPVSVKVPVSPFGRGAFTMNVENVTAPAALAGRGMKNSLLGNFGGSSQSEDAVQLALSWLARRQHADGFWSLTGESKDVKARYSKGSSYENQEAATAMALLAFLGAGQTHQSGEYAKAIDKGVQALMRVQDGQGNFFSGPRADDSLYTHAQCTMAMCELYALTKDSALKDCCERAVRYCVEAQDPNLGGWRYRPRSDSDTSVTGWMVMALQSAKNAGLEVPQQTLDKVSAYLDLAALGLDVVQMKIIGSGATPGKKLPEQYGSQYAYMPGQDYDRVMTAEALLCRMYLGWTPDNPQLIKGCEMLIEQHLPRWEDRDVYYWYYCTQTMFHMQGKFWQAWNDKLRDQLIQKQELDGPERGSWDPLDREGPDLWTMNKHGGRLYVTCFSVFMLEVYYRHLPLYSDLKKQIEKKQKQ